MRSSLRLRLTARKSASAMRTIEPTGLGHVEQVSALLLGGGGVQLLLGGSRGLGVERQLADGHDVTALGVEAGGRGDQLGDLGVVDAAGHQLVQDHRDGHPADLPRGLGRRGLERAHSVGAVVGLLDVGVVPALRGAAGHGVVVRAEHSADRGAGTLVGLLGDGVGQRRVLLVRDVLLAVGLGLVEVERGVDPHDGVAGADDACPACSARCSWCRPRPTAPAAPARRHGRDAGAAAGVQDPAGAVGDRDLVGGELGHRGGHQVHDRLDLGRLERRGRAGLDQHGRGGHGGVLGEDVLLRARPGARRRSATPSIASMVLAQLALEGALVGHLLLEVGAGHALLVQQGVAVASPLPAGRPFAAEGDALLVDVGLRDDDGLAAVGELVGLLGLGSLSWSTTAASVADRPLNSGAYVGLEAQRHEQAPRRPGQRRPRSGHRLLAAR